MGTTFLLRQNPAFNFAIWISASLSTLLINVGQFDERSTKLRLTLMLFFGIVSILVQFGQTIVIKDRTITWYSIFRRPRTHSIEDIASVTDDNENAGWFVPTEKKITFNNGDSITLSIGIDPKLRREAIDYLHRVRQK